ncbi:MAG: ABC transporter ATP-binding protein/permease [Candidatus Nomurabacteria bacterium]|nr:ABC transporter ATP-binding protein/permease [Candidatus Nomurabacteria bacterium]
MVVVAVSMALLFAGQYIFAQILELLTQNNTTPDRIFETFAPYIIGFTVLTLTRIALANSSVYLLWKAQNKVACNLATKVYDIVSYQSMRFHNNRFSGSLVSQTNKFVGGFMRLSDTMIFDVFQAILTITYTVIILGPLVPMFAVVLVILSACFILVSYLFFNKVRQVGEAAAKADNKQSGYLSDSISNILSVKSYASEKFESQRFLRVTRLVQSARDKFAKVIVTRSAVFGCVTSMIQMALIIFLIGSSAWFGIGVATLVLMLLYSSRVIDSLWGLDNVFKSINQVFGDAHEMTKILDEENEIVDVPNAPKLQVSDGAIRFADVTFTHADGKDAVFHHLDLNIAPGQRVGLVGRSGSGKTTLTKLLLRFADVDSGAIEIDGQNIAEVAQVSLRQNIAYVPQETTLFHRTIAENIAYGRPDASRDEIIAAAKLANAWEFIKDLPKGLDTLTGERGVKLSGGQRQRVAIARAILKDAPILVLDEATASLDTESEKLIQQALSRLMKGRTSIVIAHRLSTVAELDRIIVLDNGRIVEDDTHAELIARGGTYAKLWNKQTGVIE